MIGKTEQPWAFLFNSYNSVEAGTIESMLSEGGIPVLKKSKGTGAYTEIIMGRPDSGWDIYVPEDQLQQAREIISFDAVPAEQDTGFSYSDDESERGFLAAIKPAAKNIITLLIIIPMIAGFLWYILIELPRLLMSQF